jgi:sulfate adenylyltransferase
MKEIENDEGGLFRLRIGDWFVADCEMVAIGGFSPMIGFMDRKTVKSVVEKMELLDGIAWSIPIVLPVNKSQSDKIGISEKIILLDKFERNIALMTISDKFSFNLDYYCENVYNTTDFSHPGVRAIKEAGEIFIAGDIELINRPVRENIDEKYFLDPLETREEFERLGWEKVVAFQTRNPIHRAHEYLIKCAMETVDGVLIHPLVGETNPDDVPADVRMKCYEALIDNYFNKEKTMLSVLPAAMRYAGPREAVHHMIMRKNYGCTHFIIGRDHAGIGTYYGTYEAQNFVDKFAEKLEIKPLKFEHSFFCSKCGNMSSIKTCPHPSVDHIHLSGSKVRAMLKEGKIPPKEFTREEVAEILMRWATINVGK